MKQIFFNFQELLSVSNTWWPGELLPTNDVNVKMVDALTSIFTIVDNKSKSLFESLLFGYFSSSNHHVSKKSGVSLLCKLQLSKTISVFRNDQEMSCSNCVDISESKAEIVFVNNCSWDFFSDNFVKDSNFFSSGSLSLGLFV